MRTLTLCWLALLALAVAGVLLGGAGDSPWLLAAVLHDTPLERPEDEARRPAFLAQLFEVVDGRPVVPLDIDRLVADLAG